MHYAVCSDAHLGNMRRFGGKLESGLNTRCREGLATLRRTVDVAKANDCKALFVVGDLFDSDDVSGQVIAAAQQVLYESGLQVHIIVGNHDISTPAKGDHACAPLAFSQGLHTHDKPNIVAVDKTNLLLVPYVRDTQRRLLPAMAETIARAECKPSVALFHAGIVWGNTPDYLRESDDGLSAQTLYEFFSAHDILLGLAGHWHTVASKQSARLQQIGALVPTGFGNPGVDGYGALLVCEGGRIVARCEIPGPRFFSLSPTVSIGGLQRGLAQAGAFGKAVARCYVSWEVEVEMLVAAREEMTALMAACSTVEGEVLPCTARQQVAAQAAATAASNTNTLDEALYEYVGKLDLPGEVSPDDVLATCRSYLGLG